MLKNHLKPFFILLLGKPEEEEETETPKTSDNLMLLQNHPSEILVRTIEETLEKVLLQFLPKSEGAIASPTPLVPTTLLIDKENKNDLDSTEADPCQKEPETLVKEDNVKITIHESTDEEIVAEKIVEIQVDKEETDELIENGDDADDLTKALL